jgi:hypothetical protein
MTVARRQLLAPFASLSTCGPVRGVDRHEVPAEDVHTVAVLLPSTPRRVPATVQPDASEGATTAASELEGPPPTAKAGLEARTQSYGPAAIVVVLRGRVVLVPGVAVVGVGAAAPAW